MSFVVDGLVIRSLEIGTFGLRSFVLDEWVVLRELGILVGNEISVVAAGTCGVLADTVWQSSSDSRSLISIAFCSVPFDLLA